MQISAFEHPRLTDKELDSTMIREYYKIVQSFDDIIELTKMTMY